MLEDSMSIEAMKQAMEALKAARHGHCDHAWADKAIIALQVAIEAAEKPVAWVNKDDLGKFDMRVRTNCDYYHTMPLYTTPPAAQRQWVGLTDDEIDDIWNRYCDEKGESSINDAYDIARAIEAKLKEKNIG